MKHSKFALSVLVVFVVLTLAVGSAIAAKKPNILWRSTDNFWGPRGPGAVF